MFKKIFFSEIGRSSLLLFISMNLFFFLNFLFHIIMARKLGPADYGIFAVLMTIIYIYGAPTEAIQNLASRYTSKLKVKKEYGKLKFFMIKSLKKGFKISFFLFLAASIAAFPLSYILKINFWLLVTMNIVIFASFSLPVVRGVLQGRKKFSLLGGGMIIESVLKIIIAVALVSIGFGVFGAVYGVVFSLLISFVISLEFNKKILKFKEEKENFGRIKLESIPYFVSMLVILLIFGMDIILAKVFFDSDLAGRYAVLSMLGKMIFFGTMAIGKVMFPLTSERKDQNKNPVEVFKKAFVIVTILCGIATIFYGFFSKMIVSLLYGAEYLSISPYLAYSALAFSFLSLSNLILMYKLSTDQLKRAWILFFFLAIEFVALFIYHTNILEYILAFMVSNIIIFIGILILLKK